MHARQGVPDCDECHAYEENPADYVDKEICPICPWKQEPADQIIFKLFDYIVLQNAGCPIERHELTNTEWIQLGIVKSEIEKIGIEKAKEKQAQVKDAH